MNALDTSRTESIVPARQTAKRLRVAVIGCGASAVKLHLPALARSSRVEIALLIDVAEQRAQALARKYNAEAATDYRAAVGAADAAIVALPNFLHAPVSVELLNRGVHVLVEKPMATSGAECDAMIAAAERSGATLAVGLEFRHGSDNRFVKKFIASGMLGSVLSFDLRMGHNWEWPLTSDYLLRKEKAGGGVLMDFGVHLFDLLLWWLGELSVIDYCDDAAAGVEAECEAIVQSAGGARGVIELSRTRKLRNSCIFTGTRGRLEVNLWFNPGVRLQLEGQAFSLTGGFAGAPLILDSAAAFAAQVEDFVTAIETGRPPLVSGEDGRRALQVIESCYRRRRPLALPWA